MSGTKTVSLVWVHGDRLRFGLLAAVHAITSRRWRAGRLLSGVCFAAAGLQAAAAPPQASIDAVKALIGDAACDTDAQCATIAVGARACGGPDAYLAWSRKTTDPMALKAAAERHAAQRRSENQRSGMASICAIPADPGAQCVRPAADAGSAAAASGTCTLRKPGPVDAGAVR